MEKMQKGMSRYNRIKLSSVLYLVIAYLAAVIIVANVLLFQFAPLVSQMLGQDMFRVEQTGEDEDFDSEYYKMEYDSFDSLIADETEFAYRVQAEGSVLLQNAGLPLAESGAVTLLGVGSNENYFVVGGGGSGAINVTRADPVATYFTDAGYSVNPTAIDYFGGITEDAFNQVTELPANVVNSFSDYSDAGIVVISRYGAESNDIASGRLELTDAERMLVDVAIENFDEAVVLLNTMNAMEVGYLDGKDVSVLWIGGTGEVRMGAVPEILNGTRYPSGKLVDTYAYDSYSSPAMQNFGASTMNGVASDAAANAYVNYAEGIYVGYRYYETRYADVVMGTQNVGNYDYAATVQYPFGYGLSYTSFAYDNFSLQENAESFTLSVQVTNTGDRAGKEAVEFYMQSPYTDYDRQHGIEKSAVELVGFAKTGELAPGASETVSVEVEKELMRSYDAQGEKTYIVDAGDYYFATGTDAHDALNNILAAQGYGVEDGMTAAGNAAFAAVYTQEVFDSETYSYGADGEKITNQFDDAGMDHWYAGVTYLTRSDWEGTYPEQATELTATQEMLEGFNPQAQDPQGAVMPTTGADNGLSLASFLYWEGDRVSILDYNDALWDDLLDQLTPQEMMDLFALGGYGTLGAQSVNKPGTVDSDGPAGFGGIIMGGMNTFGYPCEVLFASTWNTELLEEFGNFIGEDALFSGRSAWYAPGENIHRTPYGGRNFEYYSEDPFLSGAMSAAVSRSAQENGVLVYAKHFALNEQEASRASLITFAQEQAIRQIYLKPFEDAVTDGGALGLMNAQNRVGITWAGAHEGMQVNVVRGEWGFRGVIITDAATSQDAKKEPVRALYGGTDMYLCTNRGAFEIPGFENNAAVMAALRESCHRILYSYAQTNAMNGLTASSRVVPVMPPWQIILITVDVVLGVAAVAGIVCITRGLVKMKKEGENHG